MVRIAIGSQLGLVDQLDVLQNLTMDNVEANHVDGINRNSSFLDLVT